MNSLIIEGQFSLPSVNFNPETGLLKLLGRSIPENPVKFYQPLENWIKEFLQSNPEKILFQIHLDYLNTHSTECVLMLMKMLDSYSQSNNADVKIVWSFDEDDEDMESLGEDLSSIINIPFEIKEIIGE